MKLHNLFESPSVEQVVKTLVEYIRNECSDTLSKIDPAHPLFRGVGREKQPNVYFFRDIRTDRRPSATSLESHAALIAHIKKAGGIANRDNAAFATGEDEELTYGPPFVVFPIGSIHFTWSPLVVDAYDRVDIENFHEIIPHIGINLVRGGPEYLTPYRGKLVEIFEKEYELSDTDAVDAFMKEHYLSEPIDLLLDCRPTDDVYQSFPKSIAYLKSAIKKFKSMSYKDFLKKSYPILTEKNSTLKDAIASKKEIMINCSAMKMLYIEKEFYFANILPALRST